jgi:hypothetical protein
MLDARLDLSYLESFAYNVARTRDLCRDRCKYYKNHRLTDHSATLQEAVSPLESIGEMKLYLCLYPYCPALACLASTDRPLRRKVVSFLLYFIA